MYKRQDFAWEDGRIVLEADGRVKYADAEMLGGRDAAQVLFDEKVREDALREVVDRIARTTWADAWRGAPLERTLLRLGVPHRRPAGRLTY